ncbi:MAG: Ig-like domain-containing protein, partial [Sedimenticola sp.]
MGSTQSNQGLATTDSGANTANATGEFADNSAHAHTDGVYLFRDSEGYCWMTTWDRKFFLGNDISAYDAVVEAPADRYEWGEGCVNIYVPEITIKRPNVIPDTGTDGQGNQGTGVQVTLTYTVENSGDAELEITNITSTNLTKVTVDSIPVTAFTVAIGGSSTFDVLYTPIQDGSFSFELDVANNDPNEGNYDITISGTAVNTDSEPPAVAIQNAPTSVTTADPFSVTFEFDEDVTGFALGDITVGNGTADGFVAEDANTYTADITPNGNGDLTIDVAADVAEDGASNPNTAATQVTIIFDSDSPSVQIQNAPTSVTAADPFSVTFEFDEDVTGFALGGITVGNGTASGFASTDANTYTANITPNRNGDLTIDVAANVAVDGASNPNTAATQVTVTCAAGCGEAVTVQEAQQAIQNFAGKRMVMITSQGPGLSGFLNGDGLGGGFNGLFGNSPVGLNFSGDSDHNQGSFSTSLQQFINAETRAYSTKLAQNSASAGEQEEGYSPVKSPANIWIKGRWTKAKEDRGNIDEKSDFGIVYIGADWRYSKDLL